MKRPLFVTLADKKYLEYAKQVFAGAYFNAGWRGDYMLLAHDCSKNDTEWFRKKGILVKYCEPIFRGTVAKTPISFLARLYLFTPEFKKWSCVIYLDADIIVKSSLDDLTSVRGFAAVNDVSNSRLRSYLISPKNFVVNRSQITKTLQLKDNLKKSFNLRSPMFSAGMFVFRTHLIHKDTFSKLKKYIEEYQQVCQYADQFSLNLYFYKKWQQLPSIYNLYIYNGRNQWHLPLKRMDGIILHFIGPDKPWQKNNFFYEEWNKNYKKANSINLNNIPRAKTWSQEKIKNYSKMLKNRETLFAIFAFWLRFERVYYLVVCFVEKKYPRFFAILKNSKKKFKTFFQYS